MSCYLWKKNYREFTLVEFHSLYYLHFMSVEWFSLRPYDNCRIINDIFNSNAGWHLSWFIVTGAYDVECHEIGTIPTIVFTNGELSTEYN